MSRRLINIDEALVKIMFAGTDLSLLPVPTHRQMPLDPDIDEMHQKVLKYIVAHPMEKNLSVKRLLANTSSTTEPTALPVLKELVDELDELRLLEAIYGYADGKTCTVVAIANDLPSNQRDIIWRITGYYRRRYPEIDIDTKIVQRRGQPLADVFEDDGSAILIRVLLPA